MEKVVDGKSVKRLTQEERVIEYWSRSVPKPTRSQPEGSLRCSHLPRGNASGSSPRPPRTGVIPCKILVSEFLEPSALETLALGPPQPRSNPVGEVCTRNLTAIPWMKFAPATSSRQTLEKCKPCSPELGCALAAAPRLATSPCPAGHSAPACCPARWVRRVSMNGEAVLTARPTSSVGHHHPAMAFL